MLPDLLVDRSLGRIAIPAFLRDAWPAGVRTIDEVFGLDKIPDEMWMSAADDEGWIAVCKDDRIRRRPGERVLMSQGTLRVLCLANGNLRTEAQVERFARALPSMQSVSNDPGPWMYGVYAAGIQPLTLYS